MGDSDVQIGVTDIRIWPATAGGPGRLPMKSDVRMRRPPRIATFEYRETCNRMRTGEGARMRIAPLRPTSDRHRSLLAVGETCGGPAAATASDAMASVRVTYRTRMHLSVAYIQIGRATQRPAVNVRRNAEFGVRELQWEDLR